MHLLRKKVIPLPSPKAARHYSMLNYDVWLYISSFLTLQELWNARFLNEVVFGVAMDAGYQVVHVPTDYRLFEGFSQWFSRFYGADVAHRVRTIDFSPLATLRKSSWDRGRRARASINDDLVPQEQVLSFYQKMLQQSATTLPTRSSSKLARIKHRLQRIFPVKNTIPRLDPELMMLSLAKFPIVSNIIVDLQQWQSEEEILLPLFMIKALASNLKSLSLKVPFNLVLRFLSDAPLFPNLEKLSIEKHFWDQYYAPRVGTPAETVIQPLAIFINRHADSLLSLTLQVSSFSRPYLSSIFNKLDKIPNLVSLSLYLSWEIHPQGLGQFLKQQSKTLRNLKITLEENTQSYLGADEADSVLATVCDYLEHCRLSSLEILGTYIYLLPEKLRKILGMGGGIRRLRHLALPVQVLTVDIFDLIVFELPALQSLDLTFCTFNSRNSPYQHWERDFALQMKRRAYADWGLQSLKLVNAVPNFDIVARRIVYALPNVQTFDGVSRSEYLSQLNDEESV